MFVVLLGLPGSGKGTQCERLLEAENALCLSPGEIIRKKLASGDDESKKVESLVNSGSLLSDDFIMNLVESTLKSVNIEEVGSSSTIFDGIPRTLGQAKMLDDLLLRSFGKRSEIVVFLQVKKRLLLKRLLSRVICSDCRKISNVVGLKKFSCSCGSVSFLRRKDDEKSIIRKRLKNDSQNLSMIYNYYLSQGTKCVKVDGNSNQSVVYKRLKNLIFIGKM